jgi:AraC family transcriptional activator of pobA
LAGIYIRQLYSVRSNMAKPNSGEIDTNAGGSVPAFFLYGEASRPSNVCLVHAETIAERSRIHDWNISAHRHLALHQLLLIERGQVTVRLDGMRDTLTGTALIAVPSNTIHAFQFTPDTRGIVVSFASDLVSELVRSGDNPRSFFEQAIAVPLKRCEPEVKDLTILSELLLREFMHPAPGRDSALRGLLSALLTNASRVRGVDSPPRNMPVTRDLELYTRFRQRIEHRYREHVPINTYARELAVSVARLRRACLAAAGLSPNEHVHRRLLIEAQRQLRYTTMSVTEIAYQLGFHDPAYFSRFFTRRMNIAPLAFRGCEDYSSIGASRHPCLEESDEEQRLSPRSRRCHG